MISRLILRSLVEVLSLFSVMGQNGHCMRVRRVWFGVFISDFDSAVLRLIQQERKKGNEKGPHCTGDEE